MNLVIVGSVKAKAQDTKPIIIKAINRLKPDIVGSGGAEGTDTHVEEVVGKMWIAPFLPFKKFLPVSKSWQGWHGFRWRNLKMVAWGTYFIGITSRRSTTYGSGWTIDQAEKQGKPVERFVVK